MNASKDPLRNSGAPQTTKMGTQIVGKSRCRGSDDAIGAPCDVNAAKTSRIHGFLPILLV